MLPVVPTSRPCSKRLPTASFSFPNISIAILVCLLLDPSRRRTIALYGMVILQVVLAMVTIVLALVQCQPTRKLWEKTLPGSCWSPNVLNYFSYWFCAYTTLTDVVLAVVPARAFWKLQLPRATKIGLIVRMSMTLLSAIVTVIKRTYLYQFRHNRSSYVSQHRTSLPVDLCSHPCSVDTRTIRCLGPVSSPSVDRPVRNLLTLLPVSNKTS
jgi:hypothetical protein